MPILGIDLGTTNSLVGVVDSGFPILLADGDGQRLTPSVVYYPPVGESPLVGWPARRQRMVHPDRTVTSVKRLIGKRFDEVDPRRFAYPLGGRPGAPVEVAIPFAGHSGLAPEMVSAHILSHLKTLAETAMGVVCDRAIITVPAYFNDAQRNATKRAGEMAGLQVERIINEPTAAALSFGLHRSKEHLRVAVVDLGGGTFDVSILEMREGVFHVLATHGDTYLGGDDIDEAVADSLWHQFDGSRAPLSAQSPTLQTKFREEAEKAKKALSSATEVAIQMPFVEGDRHFECLLSRNALNQLARPIVNRMRKYCLQAMHDAGLTKEALDQVVLVGGSTRMPLVRTVISEIFEKEVNTSENPDESIAMGAVIQGGVLSGELRNVVLLDVTPLSLGIESFGGLMNVIIPRNSTIPLKAGEMFTNAVAMQESMLIRVLQGEREMAKDNWELGHLEIPFTPGPKGSARIGVQFHIDENGILQVLARDTATQRDTILEIQNTAVDVDDAKVEAMIAESVEYAFEDMSERQFTEAKLKSEELLPAVDQALGMVGDALSPGECESIRAAADAVKGALYRHDLAALKEANRILDDATQHLAALLMEKAMEEAMERRGLG